MDVSELIRAETKEPKAVSPRAMYCYPAKCDHVH